MSLSLIISVVMAALKFPSEMSAFIRLISKSPEEKRQEIMKKIMQEEDNFDKTGRPTWE